MGRESLEFCFQQYFSDHGDLRSDAAQEHLHLFNEYVIGMEFEKEFDIETVKASALEHSIRDVHC